MADSKMKSHPTVSSQRRKSRRAHFSAPSHIRHKLMSCNLSRELRDKHSVRSMQVYRRRWCLYLERMTKDKANGQQIKVPVDASNCVITKLAMTKDRQNLLVRKAQNNEKLKGKIDRKDL